MYSVICKALDMMGPNLLINKAQRHKITTVQAEGIRAQLSDWDKNHLGVGRGPGQGISPWRQGDEATGCHPRSQPRNAIKLSQVFFFIWT